MRYGNPNKTGPVMANYAPGNITSTAAQGKPNGFMFNQ